MKTKIILLLALVLVGLNGWGQNPVNNGDNIPSNWKTYTNNRIGFTFQFPGSWKINGKETDVINISGDITATEISFTDTVSETTLLISYHFAPNGVELYQYAVSQYDSFQKGKQLEVAGNKAIKTYSIINIDGKGNILSTPLSLMKVILLDKKQTGTIEFQFKTSVTNEYSEAAKFNQLVSSFMFITQIDGDKELQTQTILGIDVSHWQGTINWTQVSAAGKVYAFVKATEGFTGNDANFTTNMVNGNNAGVVMGAYHFARPDNNSAVNEANHFVSIAGSYIGAGYLPPVLDIEDPYAANSLSNLSTWIQDWMTTVQNATGVAPILYTTGWYASNLSSSLNVYKLWIANYETSSSTPPTNIGVWSTWAFKQYSETGTVSGISGSVDLDVFNGTTIEFNNLISAPNTATITNAYPSPSSVNTGATFTINCTITASGNINNLLLGASISRNSIDYSDASNDIPITLVSGSNSELRNFNLSVATPTPVPVGTYDLLVALWQDNNGSETIDAGDTQLGSLYTNSQCLTISASSCTAVSITSNPSNQSVSSGNTASFSVTVSGTAPYSYFWYKNGSLVTSTTNSSSNTNSYTTPILSTSDNGNYYNCVVTNCSGSYQATSSNANLTVTGTLPTIQVSSPNGGEVWQVGAQHNISATSTGSISGYLIEYTADGSTWNNIVSLLTSSNSVSYLWTIPNTPSTTCRVRVTANGSVSDASNSNFTIISAPVVTVISPNGGEVWQAGTVHNITASTTGNITGYQIDYTTNGSTWFNIDSFPSTNNIVNYLWTIPNIQSNTCRIKVTANGSVLDVSNSNFTITPATYIENISSDKRLKIYPNPNNGSFLLKFENPSKSSQHINVSVFNLLGCLLYSEPLFNSSDNGFTLNLSTISNGVYFLHVQYEGITYVEKLMIEK